MLPVVKYTKPLVNINLYVFPGSMPNSYTAEISEISHLVNLSVQDMEIDGNRLILQEKVRNSDGELMHWVFRSENPAFHPQIKLILFND